MSKLVFLCGSRDYHAYDWYSLAKQNIENKDVVLLTDLIAGEGFLKLISESDVVYKLFIIDSFLFRKPSRLGDYWRNVLKFIVLPLQVVYLRLFVRKFPDSDFHAHGMYYMLLAALSGVSFVGTPQGSEILVRPYRSRVYRCFAVLAMRKARSLTVDSMRMFENIKNLTNRDAHIIQNGIDISNLAGLNISKNSDRYILSIRGFAPLYRIIEIFKARDSANCLIPLNFIYPFVDNEYKNRCLGYFKPLDKDLGRVNKNDMYQILSNSYLVVSIPSSDSSPRSVYEAVFCGCYVVISENAYFDILPNCMKKRILVVDPIKNKKWLEDALQWRKEQKDEKFEPSTTALELFDQKKSIQLMNTQVYL